MTASTILCGDALAVLKTLPSSSVDCCVCSPPYFALRSYLPDDHPDKHLEIGTEPTIEAYIARLCDVFDEVKRVLKPQATAWIVMADSYSGSNGGPPSPIVTKSLKYSYRLPRPPKTDIPKKSLCLIPERFAIEMVRRGWRLRNVICWSKGNSVPESVRDRFTNSFEFVFFFTISERYYFKQQFEPATYKGVLRDGKYVRNHRTVWHVNQQPHNLNHFAAYPEKLVEIPIKAGSPPGGTILDPFAGTCTTGIVAQRLGRNFIGIDLNPAYCAMARQRLESG
jgi:site-specific DNA-methyltransferase (cytosine-N4-specific)